VRTSGGAPSRAGPKSLSCDCRPRISKGKHQQHRSKLRGLALRPLAQQAQVQSLPLFHLLDSGSQQQATPACPR
jgi:hypothetical protein